MDLSVRRLLATAVKSSPLWSDVQVRSIQSGEWRDVRGRIVQGEEQQSYSGFQSNADVDADTFRFDPLEFPQGEPMQGWSVQADGLTWKVSGRARQDGSFRVVGLKPS